MPRLLVIVPDRISQIIEKGEYQPGYYNPGEVFDEVHILMTNDDKPDPAALQRTVGSARLVLHNYPDQAGISTKSWPFLTGHRLRTWAKGGVEIARQIAPDMIRCHGSDWNTYLASRIKKTLGIPYIVSLHINPDINPVRRIVSPVTKADQRHNAFYEYLEGEALRNADLVMPVYKTILPYLKRLGVARVEVCYNVLNREFLRQKTDYALSSPPHIVYVGRLFAEKDPSNIIRAVASLEGVRYTIVGDGPHLKVLSSLISELGVGDRIKLLPAVPNDELCLLLADADIFAIHTEYWEISKSILEALLTGLPVIVNKRIGEPVPEFTDAVDGNPFLSLVDNTVEAYRKALGHLLEDHNARKALGERAFTHARARWSPAKTEAKFASIYRDILAKRNPKMIEGSA
ncbi:putative glycosyl transferase, group 1 family protein [Roseibium sp. TrichSKD4]|uniref:glycosyltransferase n=1 Tax=Roseibium sp. TrichSKD4 TaxID=744980 RepID=UPI0001E56586|nr:glycosyltransferase [Roseibium sp. TrichSKD4]EFO33986.1 putative glycosyl transferase, group 1 family protein [Roseibium sp. TrichSKD4]